MSSSAQSKRKEQQQYQELKETKKQEQEQQEMGQQELISRSKQNKTSLEDTVDWSCAPVHWSITVENINIQPHISFTIEIHSQIIHIYILA